MNEDSPNNEELEPENKDSENNKDPEDEKTGGETDPQAFNKIAFWCVIHNRPNPDNAYSNLLNEHSAVYQHQIANKQENHNLKIKRFEAKITNSKERLDDLTEYLSNQKNIDEIEDQIFELREKSDLFEKSLVESYKSLGSAKANLIQDRIDQAFQELNKLTASYTDLTDTLNTKNESNNQNVSKALNIKPNFLISLRDKYNESFSKLQEKINDLNLSGVSQFSSSKLIGFGASIASGWFFSIFALRIKLDSNDIPFFILKGFFDFGRRLNSDSLAYTILFHVIFLIAVLGSVLLITLLCSYLLSNYEEKQYINQFLVKFLSEKGNENESADAKDEMVLLNEFDTLSAEPFPTNSFYSFWLHSIPLLLIFGIIFIVISIGNSGSDVTNLSISLSSQTVGTALSLGLSGIIFIYITKIIEPRIETKRNQNTQKIWMIANFELVSVITSLLIASVFLLVGFYNAVEAISNNIFPFLMFILSSLISSFTLGYGIYYTGLIEAANFIENKMRSLSLGAAFSSFPNIRTIIRADSLFRKRYLQQMNNLFRLISYKTKLAEFFFPYDDNQLNKKHQRKLVKENGNGLFQKLKSYFTPPSEPKDDDKQSTIEENSQIENRFMTFIEDSEYFPDIVCEIEQLKECIKENKAKLVALKKDKENRLEEKSAYSIELLKEIKEAQEKVDNWKRLIINLNKANQDEIRELYIKHQSEISQMQDGYNLAMWIVENDLGPNGTYYNGD